MGNSRLDEEQLIDAALAFVTDPHGSRNERPIVDQYPSVIPVLESMVVDGVQDRQDVADYMHDYLNPIVPRDV